MITAWLAPTDQHIIIDVKEYKSYPLYFDTGFQIGGEGETFEVCLSLHLGSLFTPVQTYVGVAARAFGKKHRL